MNRFGSHFANCIRRDRPQPKDKWYLDELVLTIRGEKHWLWWAIDADGDALDILVQPRRNAKTTRRFLKKLIDQFDTPRVLVTHKLRGYTKSINLNSAVALYISMLKPTVAGVSNCSAASPSR